MSLLLWLFQPIRFAGALFSYIFIHPLSEPQQKSSKGPFTRAIFIASSQHFFLHKAATSSHTCKPAAISVRFQPDIVVRFLRNPASMHQVSNMPEKTIATSRHQIGLKSPLLYTGDLKLLR